MSIIDYFLSIYLLFFIIWIFSSVCDVGLCGLPRQENKFQIPMILLCNSNFFLCVVVVVLRRVDIQITWTQICHPHRPLERDLCNLWPVDTKLGNCIGRKFASSFFSYSMQFRAIKDTTSGSPYNWVIVKQFPPISYWVLLSRSSNIMNHNCCVLPCAYRRWEAASWDHKAF